MPPPRTWQAFIGPAVAVAVGIALFAAAHPPGTRAGDALLVILLLIVACIVFGAAVARFRPLARKLVWVLAFAALAAPLLDGSYRTPLGPLAAVVGVLGMMASLVDITWFLARPRHE